MRREETLPRSLYVDRSTIVKLMEQERRTVVLLPGQIAVLHPRKPYIGRLWGNSRLLVSKFPRHGIEARVGAAGPKPRIKRNRCPYRDW
jgi:hypothetical protein